jgi:hypothetical protein
MNIFTYIWSILKLMASGQQDSGTEDDDERK